MSYCVNCGVELEASEKSCPLCNVVVNNPNKPWTQPSSRPFPTRVDKVVRQVNRNFGVGLASLALLIPSVVTFIINIFVSNDITWSAYVIDACFLVYIIVLFPFLFKKPKIYMFIALDTAALLAFLALIDGLNGFSWFVPLAMPIVLVTAALALVTATVIKQPVPGLSKAAWILIALSVFLVALEIIININAGSDSLIPHWSLFAATPCIIISIMLFYTEYHQALKEKIRRRLFY